MENCPSSLYTLCPHPYSNECLEKLNEALLLVSEWWSRMGGMLCFSPAMNPHQGSALGRFVERANTLMTKKKKKEEEK